MSLIFYHRTQEANVQAILEHGFKDATGFHHTSEMHTGVWLSDRPLDVNEGAKGKALLEVRLELSESALEPYEWVEEDKPYREWCVPSSLINHNMQAALIEED